MPFVTTADAVPRETAWLLTTGDGLPNLLADAGGRWDLINGYWRRTPPQRKRVIWVNRLRTEVRRRAHVRKLVTYHFELELWWPLANQSGVAETDQAEFDKAINDLVMRISGFGYTATSAADKTHGGRFLSVGETEFHGDSIDVDTPPSIQTLDTSVGFKGTVRYFADDFEFNN
jgi:hypothetical protein